jgi:hypothetical protein
MQAAAALPAIGGAGELGPLGWAAVGLAAAATFLAPVIASPETEPVSLTEAQLSAAVAADATAVSGLSTSEMGKVSRKAGVSLCAILGICGLSGEPTTNSAEGGRSYPTTLQPPPPATERKPPGKQKPRKGEEEAGGPEPGPQP